MAQEGQFGEQTGDHNSKCCEGEMSMASYWIANPTGKGGFLFKSKLQVKTLYHATIEGHDIEVSYAHNDKQLLQDTANACSQFPDNQ